MDSTDSPFRTSMSGTCSGTTRSPPTSSCGHLEIRWDWLARCARRFESKTVRPLPRRFQMSLLIMFSLIALVLSAAGIYGVMHYWVAQRTREIGIRMAVGAEQRAVMALVIKEGAKLSLAGVIIGLGSAFILMRLMKSLLFGVSPADPLTFVGISAFLCCVALLACYVPARRAMKIDPMSALRCE